MTRTQKLIHVLRLLRIEQPMAAVGNAWLVVFLAFHFEPAGGRSADLMAHPIEHALLIAGAISAGLVGHALALNDLLDMRRDSAFTPTRPLPAGRLARTTALAACLLCLLTALAAAAMLGRMAMFLCVGTAAATLFYNLVGRFLPAVGVTVIGLICAVLMFIPNPSITYAWPAWMAMTQAMGVAAAAHFLEGKRPRFRNADWWALAVAWTFWTLALVGWMSWARHEDAAPTLLMQRPMQWLAPAGAAVGFLVHASRALGGRMGTPRERRAAAARLHRLSALWSLLYCTAWLLGLECFPQAGAMLALFAAAAGAVVSIDAMARWAAMPPADFTVRTQA